MALDSDEELIWKAEVRICDGIRSRISALQPSSMIAKASWPLFLRIAQASQSIHVLRKDAPHDWTRDGINILRSIYDALLQLLYMLHHANLREERSALYLDFLWVEKHRLRNRIDENPTDIGKRLASSPNRSQGEKDIDEKLRQIGLRYLTKKGQLEYERQGPQYLTKAKCSYRDCWYPESHSGRRGLAGLASEVGYLSEYELFQRDSSASIHASPLSLSFAPTIKAEYTLRWAMEFALRSAGSVAEAFGIPLDEFDREVIELARRNKYDQPSRRSSQT
jgi:hypothetical protein